MASIKRDDVKQKWEETEFPLVCETCLGDNPYVRMTKEKFGKKCQICEVPFTVFAWQAGTKGRLKKVEICKTCAQAKNVCQVCIYDLQYGLPVTVRDKILRESGGVSATASAGGAFGMAIPQSQANRSWYTAQQERAIEQGQANQNNQINEIAKAKLQEMARMEPRYERNLPKLCSFFARGECDRGSHCPFRHEMPRDRNDPLSKQNTKDRFYGTNDPVAGKIIHKQKIREQKIERKELKRQGEGDEVAGGGDYEKARATLYLRFQDTNYNNRNNDNNNMTFPKLTEVDIRDQFYSFGEIVSVRVQPEKGQAFVEYTQPEAAELAIATMNRKELQGHKIFVAWARAQKRGEHVSNNFPNTANSPHNDNKQQHIPQIVRPATPPGGVSSSANNDAFVVKPPPEVAALVAARKQRTSNNDDNNQASSTINVPRPGGGVIRNIGRGAAAKANNKPYSYPSADPSRLGSKTSSS